MGHWKLDDIKWDQFNADAVDLRLLELVKAASLVEANSGDYVTYLNRVFNNDARVKAAFEQWGVEEIQHGQALGRWAEMADPSFSFERALSDFRQNYSLPLDADESVRGSRTGELVSRCVIESGTSSFYTAIKDGTDEPVLKQIAGHIAADEFRHYALFLTKLQTFEADERVTLMDRVKVAIGRLRETEDDELAMAYYCANHIGAGIAYDREANWAAYEGRALDYYQQRHILRATSMMVKAMGLHPHGWFANLMGKVTWAGFRAKRWQHQRAAGQEQQAIAA